MEFVRVMPVVDLETPTLCLFGAPNVGKSSLVPVLSTGTPEICNYPFTTRGILMGYIVSNYQHFRTGIFWKIGHLLSSRIFQLRYFLFTTLPENVGPLLLIRYHVWW